MFPIQACFSYDQNQDYGSYRLLIFALIKVRLTFHNDLIRHSNDLSSQTVHYLHGISLERPQVMRRLLLSSMNDPNAYLHPMAIVSGSSFVSPILNKTSLVSAKFFPFESRQSISFLVR